MVIVLGIDKLTLGETLPDSISSVRTLITLLWIKSNIPASQRDHWPIFEASLAAQAELAANRIIYHAQFALDHLTRSDLSSALDSIHAQYLEDSKRPD